MSTIVFNRVSDRDVPALGPHAATLKGYRAAQWTAFGFAMICASPPSFYPQMLMRFDSMQRR